MSSEPKLIQNVRWGENYVSQGLNRKLYGLVLPGVYKGFEVKPAGKMRVFIDHASEEQCSVAVVERDGYSLTVIMEDGGYVDIPAAGEWFICLEAYYSPKQTGYERIVARETTEPHHIILAKVTVTDAEEDISEADISLSERAKCEPVGYNYGDIIKKALTVGQLGEAPFLGNVNADTLTKSGWYWVRMVDDGEYKPLENNWPMEISARTLVHVSHSNENELNHVVQQHIVSNAGEFVRGKNLNGWSAWMPVTISSSAISRYIYLSKNGSDKNLGLLPDYPVLTTERAMEVANAIKFTSSNRVVRLCFGAGDWGDITFNSLPFDLYIYPYDKSIPNEYSESLPKFGFLSFTSCKAVITGIVADHIDSNYSQIEISAGYKRINSLYAKLFSNIYIKADPSVAGDYEIAQSTAEYIFYVENYSSLVLFYGLNIKLVSNISTNRFFGVYIGSNLFIPDNVTFNTNGFTFTGSKLRIDPGCSMIAMNESERYAVANKIPGESYNMQKGALYNGYPVGY